jgi:hypothetical protein
MEERERKRKKSLRYTENPMITPPVLLEISQRDETNDIKKDHQR